MRRRALLRAAAGAVSLSALSAPASAAQSYEPLGSVPVEDANEAVVGPDGEVAYVAATSGFATVDVSDPADPSVLAEERRLLSDREDGPLPLVQDAKVDGDRLAVVGPDDPISEEAVHAMVLYDVSDPADPRQVGVHETDYPIHNCDLAEGVAYLTRRGEDRNELVLVDASGDDPAELGRWSLADRNEEWTEIDVGPWSVHDVWVADDRAYVAHWDAGTWILDVSDPGEVTSLGSVGGRTPDELLTETTYSAQAALPGNAHYVMADPDASVVAVGKEAWALDPYDDSGGPGGIVLWDVSDPTNPAQLSTIDPPPTADPTREGTWTTAHNFDIRDGRLFSSWYQGGVKIHDVSDPADPRELAWWREPDETAFWTAKRATPEFFVASTIWREGTLYTFPDRAGRQDDPPSLTTTAEPTTTRTTTSTTTDPETTTTATTTTTRTTTTTDDADADIPGFGVAAAVAALGVGAWARLRDDGG